MKENKLKKMAENNKFEELMNNKQELERLSKIEDISEVLEVLNKYGYNGNKQDLEQDLFEILQDLSEDDLKNISGGKILNKKYLAGLMGGLTMIGATSLNTSARAEIQSNVQTKSETSFLNEIDKTKIGIAGTSLAVGGIFVEALNLMFRKTNIEYITQAQKTIVPGPNFSLNVEHRKIYENTKKLSDMILKYVRESIDEHKKMPDTDLHKKRPEHKKILNLVATIREDWLNMYEDTAGLKLNEQTKKRALRNKPASITEWLVCPVTLTEYALADLYSGLPVGHTYVGVGNMPAEPQACADDLGFLKLLGELAYRYRWAFTELELSLR